MSPPIVFGRDLIEMFEILKDFDRVGKAKLCPGTEGSTANRHDFKLLGKRAIGKRRKHFYTQFFDLEYVA